MPQLPTRDSLGSRPIPRASRNVVSINRGGVARAGAELGEKIANFGQQQLEREDKLAYAKARSDLLLADIQARRDLEDDHDYAGYEAKYSQAMSAARGKARQLIQSRSDLEAFDLASDEDMVRGAAQIQGIARGKIRDANRAGLTAALNSQQDAYLNAADEGTRTAIIGAVNDLVDGTYETGDIDEAERDSTKRGWVQSGQVARFNRAITAEDYAGARQILDTSRPFLDWQVEGQLEAQLRPAENHRDAVDAATAIYSADAGGALPEMGQASPSDVNAIFAALIQQESGGRAQYGPMTKWGRAEGSTQMLPATAKQVAQRIGVAWRPDLMGDNNSREALQYQQSLGRAYFEEGLQRYGGDIRMALQFYHGGPDQKIWGPKTRKYATDVLARAGSSGGNVGIGSQDLTQLYSRLDANADQLGWSLEQKERVRSELDRMVQRDQAIQSKAQQEVASDMDVALTKGTLTEQDVEAAYSMRRITPSDRASLIAGVTRQNKEREAWAAVQASIQRGGPLDGKDAKVREGVDLDYRSRFDHFMQSKPSEQAIYGFVSDYVARVGFVPPSLEADIRTQLRSVDPGKQIAAANMLHSLSDRNPAVMQDFSEADISRGQQISTYIGLGMEPSAAVQRVSEDERMPKAQRDEIASRYSEQAKAKPMKAGKILAEAFGANPTDIANSIGSARLEADFEQLRKSEYLRTGNMDVANATALKLIRKNFGYSLVNGQRGVVKYPPEASYGVHQGDIKADAKWIREQAIRDLLGDGMSEPNVEGRFVLIPHTTIAPINGRPVYQGLLRQPDGTFQTVIDARGNPKVFVPDWAASAEAKRERRRVQGEIAEARKARQGR